MLVFGKRRLRRSGWHIPIAVCLFLLMGFILLFWVSAFPKDTIRQHIIDAEQHGFFNENYPKDFLLFRQLDMFTECAGLGIAATLRPTFEQLTTVPVYGECRALQEAIINDFPEPTELYPRYIHGYQLVVIPLYTFFSFTEVRWIVGLIGVGFCLALCLAMAWRIGLWAGAVMAVGYVFALTHHVFLLSTHAAGFWVVLVGALAVTLGKEPLPLMAFALLGVADAFVSFLTMGSLSLSLPLLCYALTRYYDGLSSFAILKHSFWCAVVWSCAFLFAWLCKWGLAWLYLPSVEAIFDVRFDAYSTRNVDMFLLALFNNLKRTAWQLWAVVFVFLGVRLYRHKIKLQWDLSILAFSAIMPVIWMALIPGHSGVKHSSFVTIILWTPLTACLFWLWAQPRTRPCRTKETPQQTTPEQLVTLTKS